MHDAKPVRKGEGFASLGFLVSPPEGGSEMLEENTGDSDGHQF